MNTREIIDTIATVITILDVGHHPLLNVAEIEEEKGMVDKVENLLRRGDQGVVDRIV